MGAYEIILADDHAMVRHGIKKILEESGHYKIIAEAADGIELMNLLKKFQPQMVILDISMPGLRGLEATREIKCIYSHIKVLILSMHKNEGYLNHALSAGCDGYLLKEDADGELFTAIEAIRRGETYVSTLFLHVAGTVQNRDQKASACREDCGLLTTREKQVLQLVAEAKSNKEIAELLFLSVRTVEHHRANIMRKLGMHKTADLFQYAAKQGFLDYSN
ncbi:MAG: response regulator transcription factor [Deltaproteobacteria bacterium]|nr:response regulator transcription factor [Deltaproteobacteria bacterium]